MKCRSIVLCLAAICCFTGTPAHAGGYRDDWHGSGWPGTAWGASDWGYAFRRDPIVGAYGPRALDVDPYASYRNDNGCYRILPVVTPYGIRPGRVFVCDY